MGSFPETLSDPESLPDSGVVRGPTTLLAGPSPTLLYATT